MIWALNHMRYAAIHGPACAQSTSQDGKVYCQLCNKDQLPLVLVLQVCFVELVPLCSDAPVPVFPTNSEPMTQCFLSSFASVVYHNRLHFSHIQLTLQLSALIFLFSFLKIIILSSCNLVVFYSLSGLLVLLNYPVFSFILRMYQSVDLATLKDFLSL